jgi:hypothetical protein
MQLRAGRIFAVNCSIFLLLCLAPSIYKHRPAEANSSVVGDESYVGVSDKLPTMSKVKYQDEISCTDANTLSMLLVVLAAYRYESLRRLLTSLSRNNYGCSVVDLQISIDKPLDLSTAVQEARERSIKLALEFEWRAGTKTVFRRLKHVGLSQSWFEATYASGGYEYLGIFEDDMQVSRNFFPIFASLHNHIFAEDSVTAFCLHPADWEVRVPRACNVQGFSNILYESPEPCNWGPMWRFSDWRAYISWVSALKDAGELPYVPEDVSYNFNKYLNDGKDVQSSWVWRYNYDFSKRQVRYSIKKCLMEEEIFLAINHKEPGEHFKQKLDLDTDPQLLEFSLDAILKLVESERWILPLKYGKYDKGAKSLRG